MRAPLLGTELPFLQFAFAHVEREVSGNQGRNFQDGHFMGMFADCPLAFIERQFEAGQHGALAGDLMVNKLPRIDRQQTPRGGALEGNASSNRSIARG